MEELQQKIEELTQRINTLEQAQNLNYNKLMFTELDKEFSKVGYVRATNVTAYGADLQRNINLTGNPQTITVPENPTDSAIVKASDGNNYRILLYSLT